MKKSKKKQKKPMRARKPARDLSDARPDPRVSQEAGNEEELDHVPSQDSQAAEDDSVDGLRGLFQVEEHEVDSMWSKKQADVT